jgi:hypothetical protein
MSSGWNIGSDYGPSRLMLIILLLAMPTLSADAQEASNSQYSRRLGIYYEFVRYGNAFGARLKTDPVPGSPLLQAQAQLERGDMLTHLDGYPITGTAQLENHHSKTSVTFVNVRTGRPEVRWVYLPIQGAPGVPPSFSVADRVLPPISDVPPPPPDLIVPDIIRRGS